MSVVASTLFFAGSCWGGSIKAGETSSVVGLELDSLEAVVERRTRDTFKPILGHPSHPIYDELWQMGSTFSHRLISRCTTERSYVSAAIRLYNSM